MRWLTFDEFVDAFIRGPPDKYTYKCAKSYLSLVRFENVAVPERPLTLKTLLAMDQGTREFHAVCLGLRCLIPASRCLDCIELAIKAEQTTLVKWMLTKVEDRFGRYGFYTLCEDGRTDLVELYLENGVVLEWMNDGLEYASFYGYLDMAKSLVRHGATNLNRALAHACERKHTAMIKYLVEQGADECWSQFHRTLEDHLEFASVMLTASQMSRWGIH
jgi:hypothetical protein